MELHTIPYEDKVLIYRPLKKLAFVGNGAMARLCRRLSEEDGPVPEGEAGRFLEAVGFFEPDAPEPDFEDGTDGYKPTVCVLFLTRRCNLRCVYCYARGGEEDGTPDMAPSLARLAIGQACRNAADSGRDGFEVCFHGGGEPTESWSALKDAVRHARRAPLKATISLTSNGAWTKAKLDWIIANVDQVSLSFDGPAEVQDGQRPRKSGAGSHAGVWRTIRALDAANLPYGIRMTVTDRFVDKIPESIDYLCRETASSAFQVEPAFPRGRGRDEGTALSGEREFAKRFIEGYDVACSHRRHMYYSGARPWLLTSRFCQACDSALIVGHDGLLSFCYEVCDRRHELAGDFLFGRLGSDGGVQVDFGRRLSFRNKIERRRQGCRSCFCFRHCAGDCPAKTFSPDSGELSLTDRCWLNREITKNILIRYIERGGGVWRGEGAREAEGL